MTNKEIIELAVAKMKESPKLKKWYGDTPSDNSLWNYIFDEMYDGDDSTFKKMVSDGECKDGHNIYSVVSVELPEIGEVMIRIDGTYDSWGGDNWGDSQPYLVEYKEVTTMEYVAI